MLANVRGSESWPYDGAAVQAHTAILCIDWQTDFCTGIITDVCVHTIMREANNLGYECPLLADCTGATDYGNYLAALNMIKM